MTVQAGGAVLVLAAAVLGLWRYGVQRRQRRTLVWALAAAIGEMESAIRWQQTPMMALLEGLAAESTCLVSCGGGVAMRQENVAAMRRCGTVVLLTARPEVILERVKDSDERPLLQGKKNVADIAALMAQRRGAYEAAADVTVDTSDLTIEEVCRAVLRQVNET